MSFRSLNLSILAVLFLFTPMAAFAGSAPSVTDFSTERTETDQLIRLIASPKPEVVESKIVCSNEVTRVRLDGIFARKADVQVIPIKERGPITFARLISRGAKGSVIQLFAGRRNMSVCARTHVSHLGGEIIISTSLTDSEIARFNKNKQAHDSIRRVIITETAMAKDDVQPAEGIVHTPETKQTGEGSGLAKIVNTQNPKKKSTKKSNKKPFSKDPKEDVETLGSIRYAAGFGFAAIIAGIAIYVMRRKKQIAGPDSGIEIISTKRIGPRQQLALASVQGKNFLLAVNDKNISTLGELPSPRQAEIAPYQNTALLSRFAEEMNQSATRPKSIDTSQPEIQRANEQGFDTNPAMKPPSSTARFEFGKELRKELSSPTISEPVVEKSGPIASNVAGLIAMARSKSAFNKPAKKSQRVEA